MRDEDYIKMQAKIESDKNSLITNNHSGIVAVIVIIVLVGIVICANLISKGIL